jgi:hypothetical protein
LQLLALWQIYRDSITCISVEENLLLVKGSLMKKALVVISIFVCGSAAYLYYDWDVKTKKMAAEPAVTLYSWTDENGAKHFTNKRPPKEAKGVKTSNGYKFVEPPLIVKIKNITIEYYRWIKNKLFED